MCIINYGGGMGNRRVISRPLILSCRLTNTAQVLIQIDPFNLNYRTGCTFLNNWI